jgi:hypothetical protein
MRLRVGVALPAVLLSMALTSALVVGGVYAARQQRSMARLSSSATELHGPLEQVLVGKVTAWDTAGRSALVIGAVIVESPVVLEGVSVTTRIRRLNQHAYWLVAEAATASSYGIQSRLGLLVHAREGEIRPVPDAAWMRIP